MNRNRPRALALEGSRRRGGPATRTTKGRKSGPVPPRLKSYEDKWLFISGTIGGAYLAMHNGADPRRCMETIWQAHQELLLSREHKP